MNKPTDKNAAERHVKREGRQRKYKHKITPMKKLLLRCIALFVMMMAFGQNDNARFLIYDRTTQKNGLIDREGNVIVEPRYDWIGDEYGIISSGVLLVELDSKKGFIDETGKEIAPCIYDDAYTFSEGMAPVQKDGKWGFIDETGKVVVPCKYEGAVHFNEGLACVEMDGKWGFVDKYGHCTLDY